MIKKILSALVLYVGLFTTASAATSPTAVFLQTDRSSYISGDDLLFGVLLDTNTLNDSLIGNDVLIDITTVNGSWIVGTVAKRNHGVASGLINIPDSLPTGYYRIRAYTNYPNVGNYFCQREFYVTNRFGKEPNTTLRTNDLATEKPTSAGIISLAKNEFRTKEKIELTLQSVDNTSAIVRIISKKQWDGQRQPIAGKCEPFDFEGGFRPITPYDGVLITGTVTDSIGMPIKDAVVFTSFQDSVIRLRYDISDENGRFCTLLHDYFGQQQIFVNAFNSKLEPYLNARITLDNQFCRTDSNNSLTESYQETDSLELNKAIISKAFDLHLYKPQETASRPESNYEQYVIGIPAHSIKTDDYVAFTDFNEIAREVLPFIRIRKNKGIAEMRIVTDFELKRTVNANPFIIVDGVPLPQLAPLLKCGSAIIKQVDTQTRPRYFGNIIFENGILVVWTHKQNFWDKLSVPGTFSFTIQGFQPPLESGRPEQSKDKLPDLRQTTYWNPTISANNGDKIEIELSDETGEFVIEFIGINRKGEIIKDFKLINVK